MSVEKDGYLAIEFMDGEYLTIPFSESTGWGMDSENMCVIVHYGDHHDRFPFVNVRRFGPHYNSPEVIKALVEEEKNEDDRH